MINNRLRHQSSMRRISHRFSHAFAMLLVVCVSGCQDEQASTSVPTRWIKVSVTAGQEDPKAVLTERDFNRIKETIPTITTAVPMRFSNSVISNDDQTKPVIVCATFFDMQSLLEEAKCEIVEGRFFTLSDGQNGEPVIVISQPLASELFPNQSAIDETVSFGKDWFKIVGVLGKPKSSLIELKMADVYTGLNPLLEPGVIELVPDNNGNPPSMPLDHIWLKVGDLHEAEVAKEIVRNTLKQTHPGIQYSIDSEYEVKLNKPQ